MHTLGIEGVWLYEPQINVDERGRLFEAFSGRDFLASVGYSLTVAQVNCTVTTRGGIRGLHYADVPPGQSKYITCLAGSILDVAVDLRLGSPTFGHSLAIQLDAGAGRALYLSEGLGHAFMALSETATALYLCSTPYTPEHEHGIDPLDPELGIEWPAGITPILSARDRAAPSLGQARIAGALPSYQDWRAFTEGLANPAR